MVTKKASFEENMKRLEEIVEQMESGNLPLEDTVKLYKEGMALSAKCGADLKKVEQDVKKVTETAQGDVKLELFPEADE
jgi:exodeoxyribonuclease VII small subunit